MKKENDYFADVLLLKLDDTDPVYAAYEAQDISKSVGFDFSSYQDVVDRALDEIREAQEAFIETGQDARAHFGDELADIMFSIINLCRHAGLCDLPSLQSQIKSAPSGYMDKTQTTAMIDAIGAIIKNSALINEHHSKELLRAAQQLCDTGLQDCIVIAQLHGFNPIVLLRENVRKYLLRCQAVEKLASVDNKQWSDLARNNEIVKYWQVAKNSLKSTNH